MSYFPRAARVFVVLALTGAAAALPAAAVAAEHPRTVHKVREADSRPTRQQVRAQAAARARAAAAEAARVAAARLHALALARMQLRLRQDKRLPKRASIVFDKNWKNPFKSLLTFRAWARTGPKGHKKWVLVEQASWRAGAGLSGAAGRDECHRGQGWLPNGTYSFVQHNRRKAPLVNGRVFELQTKACARNGTVRQMLFIHSEQTTSNTQCKNRPGDDGCRWEVPVYNDYRSYGCIKMSPSDLKNLTRRFHHYFRSEVRYSTRTVKVRVTS